MTTSILEEKKGEIGTEETTDLLIRQGGEIETEIMEGEIEKKIEVVTGIVNAAVVVVEIGIMTEGMMITEGAEMMIEEEGIMTIGIEEIETGIDIVTVKGIDIEGMIIRIIIRMLVNNLDFICAV